jgi:histidine triad (HIT) family protein
MEDCIFCKIVEGKIPSVKIWEDEGHIAILDINPNTKGMTVVFPKRHYDSYVFDMPDGDYEKFLGSTKKVAGLLEKGLGVRRVALVMEGMGINHAHMKLYPLFGLDEKFQEMWAKDRVFFKKYEGYVTTQLGPQAKLEDLKKVAEEIKNKNGD